MKVHGPNFINYNPNPVGGGALHQQFPNVYVYPWIPNTPAGVGTTRQQPHERPAWFARAIPRPPRAAVNVTPPAGSPPKGSTCKNCPNCSKECMGGINK